MSHCSGILRTLNAQPLRSRDLGHSLDIRSILGQAVYALQNGDFKLNHKFKTPSKLNYFRKVSSISNDEVNIKRNVVATTRH